MTAHIDQTYTKGTCRILVAVSTAMMLLFIAGCTSNAPRPETSAITGPVAKVATKSPHASPSSVLDVALIEQLRQLAHTDGAMVARARLQQEQLQGVDWHTELLITAIIEWTAGNVTRAKALLSQLLTTDNSPATDLALQQLQHILELEMNWLEAAEIAYLRSRSRISEQTADTVEQLWSLLQRIDRDQLQRAMVKSTDDDWQQWLALCASYQEGRQAVATWLTQNPNHLGAQQLPGALSTWLQTTPPSVVAVILPLSGPLQNAGNAVLDGMISSVYQRYPIASTRPSLVTIDSNRFDSISSAYKEAENLDATVVVGPLTKANVQQLGTASSRSIPVIALNRPEVLLPSEVASWSALSLAPEDEARQLARIAYGESLRRAVLITPNSDWGQRMTTAFKETWRRLGGQMTSELVIDKGNPLSPQISQAVGSAQAEARVKAFEDAFPNPIEARPRRREDFDVIFLLTPSPAEARAIRPLLVFHYSGEVPVYAPSTIYADDNPVQNRDLNNVRFLEIPSMLGATKDLRFRRLNALGADAIRMLDHYAQALETRTPLFAGETGLLQRAGNGDIIRELDLVVFADDNIRPVNLPLR